MFIPYDYQLDYLNALHLFYYAFPPPIKVRYYSLENKADIAQATEVTKSYYTHPLDDTSIAKYSQIDNLPVYFSTQAEPKVNQANEQGNIFNQNNFTVVIPAIFGLEPEIDDMVYFTSTNVYRLYRVTNIEVVNLFESGQIRAFKIQLDIDKHTPDAMTEDRIGNLYEFSFDFYKIFDKQTYDYLYNSIMPLITFNLAQLDVNATSTEFVNVFLSYLYQKYKFVFDILINKNNFTKMDPLIPYQDYQYSMFFDYPTAVSSIPDVNNFDLIQQLVNNLNNNQPYDQYLPDFANDYVNHTIKPVYNINQLFDRVIFVNYCFKEINLALGI